MSMLDVGINGKQLRDPTQDLLNFRSWGSGAESSGLWCSVGTVGHDEFLNVSPIPPTCSVAGTAGTGASGRGDAMKEPKPFTSSRYRRCVRYLY